MSDTDGPIRPDGPDTGADPFRELRLPVTPLAPRPAFAAELRRRIDAELRADDPTSTATSTATTTAAPTTATPTTSTSTTTAPTTRTATTPEATMSTTDTANLTNADVAATASGGHRAKPVLSPYLAVAGAAEAIDWYVDVLGAVETLRYTGDDGRIGHCELVISGSTIMLADEFPEMGVNGPGAYGGTPVMLHLELADVDYTYQRAIESGAEPQRPPADQGHGNRNATIVDPFGHRWMLSQPLPAGQVASTGSGDATPPEPSAGTAEESTADASRGPEEAWRISGRAPVEPGYLTINPVDPLRAREFFSALFAWDFTHANADGSGHVGNTRFPLGIAPPRFGADAGHAATTVYFRVDDPEHYARLVEELGGRVIERNEYDSGNSISCEDDQGYRFELWQPASGY